jgi:hypothetical protein
MSSFVALSDCDLARWVRISLNLSVAENGSVFISPDQPHTNYHIAKDRPQIGVDSLHMITDKMQSSRASSLFDPSD